METSQSPLISVRSMSDDHDVFSLPLRTLLSDYSDDEALTKAAKKCAEEGHAEITTYHRHVRLTRVG